MSTPVDPFLVRFLAVALCATISVIAALIGGFLTWVNGASPASAVLHGGGIFAGALILAFAVAGVLRRGL